MSPALTVAALALLPLAASAQQETILGAYVFHRHGDRTSKSTPPTNLTDLGYQEVYASGQYYRSRYISSNGTAKISGISTDVLKASQLNISAPADAVLFTSALGFMQGVYPPAGGFSSQVLRNGTVTTGPLNGYQLPVISQVSTGANAENNAWLQDATGCNAAVVSSNDYFYSPQYKSLLNSTNGFYQSLLPTINSTFAPANATYKNAYTIFDYLNVAWIHNQSIPSSGLLTDETRFQLRTLADQHELNLAWNASSPMRAVAGKQLAAEAVQFLNQTITSGGKSKLGIQFGAYATMLSYFGLSGVYATNPAMWTGIPDYSSSMVWELFTNVTVANGTFPASRDLYVRWLYNNGTAAPNDDLTAYALFGRADTAVSWNDFVTETAKFSIGDSKTWCQACNNTGGTCAQYVSSTSSASGSSSTSSSSSSDGGISKAVAGVIGAMVTLGVILLVEAIVLLAGGFRLVKKGKSVDSGSDLSTGGKA